MGRATRFGLTSGILVCSVAAFAWQGRAIPFPKDYRKWAHVKSTLVGPQSKGFAMNGGYHHFYANEQAFEGYRTGTFPDGAVLIDDGLEATEHAGVTSEGPRTRVAVMVKDSGRFRESGGWGFEVFPRDTREGVLTAEGRASCLSCHQKAERDSVYSRWRE